MEFLQPLGAVLLVLGLLGAMLFVLKKKGVASFPLRGVKPAETKQLEQLERIALGPQHTLHLIRAGRQLVLVATAPGSTQFMNLEASEAKAA